MPPLFFLRCCVRLRCALNRDFFLFRLIRWTVILGLCCLSLSGWGAVFGADERTSYADTSDVEKRLVMNATGSVVCLDGTVSSGFVVDVADFVVGEIDFRLVATSARALFVPETGQDRGRCAFVPAVAPGVYLKIEDHLVGERVLKPADSNDWAFGKIPKGPTALGAIAIAFEDLYDFDPDLSVELWNVGFEPQWKSMTLARDCMPDDKSRYPALLKVKESLAHMVIHDCDSMPGAIGGPLLLSKFGETRVIAVNSGGAGDEDGSYYGVPYDPRRSFHNYSRRFDTELEQKLIAFLSRFAHLKHPTATIAARSELVTKVQSNLTRLGFDPGPTDGLTGVKTREAVRAFQVTLGITPTGVISEELLLLLESR